jgi:flagellar FliL protein
VSAPEDTSDGDGVAAKKPRLSRKLLLIIGAVVVVLIGGGIAAYMIFGRSGAATAGHHAEAEAAGEEGKLGEAFVEIPPMVVNLRSADGAARFIKLRLMLVPANAEAGTRITAQLPLIIDSFQPFLRELRPEDLAGSAAVFRIKEELLLRANAVTGAGSVKGVLIQDLIQQ